MKRTAVLFLAVVAMFGLFGTAQTAVAQTTLSGHFVTIWPDTQGGEQPPRHYLIDRSGKWIELEVGDTVKRLRSLDRKQVTVEGSYEESLAATDSGAPQVRTEELKPKFRVRAILPDKESFAPMAAEMTAQAAIIGSKPWAIILCRFADSIGDTPRERPWFEGIMTGIGYPSMDHFWRELSYDQVNFSGSRVFGWYNLPHPRSHYVSDTNGDGVEDADLGRLSDDCAVAADAEVYFPQYAGIDFVFNKNLGCCAWSGGAWLTLDNSSGQGYGATWLPPWAFTQSIIAHERGHSAFGFPHSSGPYNTAYDSWWDPMSGSFYDCNPPYGCVSAHTISFHKEMAGWIPPGRLYMAAPGSSVTIEIERLAQPVGTGYLMAKIPIAGSTTEFYTVETRKRIGYDSPLPDNTVLIHRVDTSRWDRQAQVVDVDNNGDPNDAAAMWLPGETFTDANGISVAVVSATANGFLVTISNGSAPPPPQQFTLAVSKNGNGTITASGIYCGSDCQEQFSDGTTVALSAVSDAGWAFSGWSGDSDCSDGQVLMSRDIACHAEFVSIPPPEPRPNLSGWFWSLAKRVKNGRERVSFKLFVQNNGVLPLHGPFLVAFYVSDDAILDGSDSELWTSKLVKNKKGLAPGMGVGLKGKKVVLPVPGSGKYLLAVIDPWNQVPESDEQDNVVAIQIP